MYCTGSTDNQLAIRMRRRASPPAAARTGDLHADRALDLVAHLDGDGLPELHLAGDTPVEVTLARRKNARAMTTTRPPRRDDGVAVDRQPEPVPDRRRGGRPGSRPRQGWCLDICESTFCSNPSGFRYIARRRAASSSPAMRARTESTWNRARQQHAQPHGAKVNAMARPTAVITGNRIAEVRRVEGHLQGVGSWAVMELDRPPDHQCVEQTERHPDPEEQAERRMTEKAATDGDDRGPGGADDRQTERDRRRPPEDQWRVLGWTWITVMVSPQSRPGPRSVVARRAYPEVVPRRGGITRVAPGIAKVQQWSRHSAPNGLRDWGPGNPRGFGFCQNRTKMVSSPKTGNLLRTS